MTQFNVTLITIYSYFNNNVGVYTQKNCDYQY